LFFYSYFIILFLSDDLQTMRPDRFETA